MSFLTIGVCGQVSAGKTSFINALCGGFVGSTSLSRETFQPESIYLSTDGNIQNLQYMESEMIKIRKQNDLSKKDGVFKTEILERNRYEKNLPSYLGRNVRLIDFPGINDSADKEGKFYNILIENIVLCDLLIYI